MAADYLREIKTRQPIGPYYLCGYSFGGLVAVEIARRLAESGNEVGLVGLFDTMLSPLRAPLRAWRSLINQRTARFVRSAPVRSIKVAVSGLIASARYRPRFYRGQLTLFAPVAREAGLPSLATIWRQHARSLATIETAGEHDTMLSALNADSTAALLTRCLPTHSASTRWTNEIAIEPSPTAEATRLILPARTSPTANTPGRLVSSR